MRQAANCAIDRAGLCTALLNDTCAPAISDVYPGHPWFGNPRLRYEYNPQKARDLLKQAGYEGQRLKTSVLSLPASRAAGGPYASPSLLACSCLRLVCCRPALQCVR
ncbi:MAG: ABC transporter substrate-binding protein [Candidatus Tectimicrobiota bacterium]